MNHINAIIKSLVIFLVYILNKCLNAFFPIYNLGNKDQVQVNT
jgi:hypothetical protein